MQEVVQCWSVACVLKLRSLIWCSQCYFLKMIRSGTHSNRKFGRGGCVILMPGKKVLERCPSLHPEQRSDASVTKIVPAQCERRILQVWANGIGHEFIEQAVAHRWADILHSSRVTWGTEIPPCHVQTWKGPVSVIHFLQMLFAYVAYYLILIL
jgi:hypothetical protein